MRERVLVLDDSDEVRTIVAETISAHGFVPVPAESAEEALQLTTADPPDVAIVDQHLAGASGMEFARLLRASPDERLRTLPVIGLSDRPWSERDLMQAGACCFVRKPIEESRLVRAIRWALEVYRPEPESPDASRLHGERSDRERSHGDRPHRPRPRARQGEGGAHAGEGDAQGAPP